MKTNMAAMRSETEAYKQSHVNLFIFMPGGDVKPKHELVIVAWLCSHHVTFVYIP